MRHLNYNHLYYFWTVARDGTIARAAERLYLTPQTISGQLRLLEESMGTKLFARSGRNLVLTDTGQDVFRYADEIFQLGTELTNVIKGKAPSGALMFRVGITDVVPKLIAYRILQPALHLKEPVQMICQEGKLGDLLADLSIHKLDAVLSDSPLSPTINVRAFNHLLGETGVTFFASSKTAKRYRRGFPRSLNNAPTLIPAVNTALRRALEQWFEKEGIFPAVVAEFEDSALMKAFGHAGAGVFAGPTATETEITRQYDVQPVGHADTIQERFYVISAERRLKHPAVIAISDAARETLFSMQPPG